MLFSFLSQYFIYKLCAILFIWIGYDVTPVTRNSFPRNAITTWNQCLVYTVQELKRDPSVYDAYNNKCMSAFGSTITFKTFIQKQLVTFYSVSLLFTVSKKNNDGFRQQSHQTVHIVQWHRPIWGKNSHWNRHSNILITSLAIFNIFPPFGYWLFYFLLRLLLYSIGPDLSLFIMNL